MSNEVIQETTPLVECSAFHRGMSVLEASLRNTEDSEAIINGLLKGAAEFYGASRASVVEADWELGIGVITYEWCKDGVPAQRDMLQCLPTLSVIGLDKLVVGKNGTFQINPDYNIHTDFDRFEDACIQLKTEEKPDMRHSLYHTAINLYKGQLLPRCEHELWLMQLSMYYQSLYLQITKGYVRLKMECKDYILAQKTAIDALRFDPKDSELNMYAILTMGFQGNLSMAQTYYTAAKPYLALEHAEVIKKYLNVK